MLILIIGQLIFERIKLINEEIEYDFKNRLLLLTIAYIFLIMLFAIISLCMERFDLFRRL